MNPVPIGRRDIMACQVGAPERCPEKTRKSAMPAIHRSVTWPICGMPVGVPSRTSEAVTPATPEGSLRIFSKSSNGKRLPVDHSSASSNPAELTRRMPERTTGNRPPLALAGRGKRRLSGCQALQRGLSRPCDKRRSDMEDLARTCKTQRRDPVHRLPPLHFHRPIPPHWNQGP